MGHQPEKGFLGKVGDAVLAIAAVLAMGFAMVLIWDALVFLFLRRWFRYLPPFELRSACFGIGMLFMFSPLLYFGPLRHHDLHIWYGCIGIFTTTLMLIVLRAETKAYIQGLANRIAEYQAYIEANGGKVHGDTPRV